MSGPLVLTVANHKGGAGKTYTAAYMSHALDELGYRVLGIDADPQASLLKWEANSPEAWPLDVMGKPTNNLHRDLAGMTGSRYDVVVIDTPGHRPGSGDTTSGIIASALRVATFVVVPLAPSGIEYEEVKPLLRSIADSGPLRPSGEPPEYAVLLTRATPNTVTLAVFREELEKDGVPVLPGFVGARQSYIRNWKNNIHGALATGYGDAVRYILGERGGRHEQR